MPNSMLRPSYNELCSWLLPEEDEPWPEVCDPLPESRFQSSVLRRLKDESWSAYKANDGQTAGVPDVFAGTKDLGAWLELKSEDKGYRLKHPVTTEQAGFARRFDLRPLPVLLVVARGPRLFSLLPLRLWTPDLLPRLPAYPTSDLVSKLAITVRRTLS